MLAALCNDGEMLCIRTDPQTGNGDSRDRRPAWLFNIEGAAATKVDRL